jgi:hypothetical protein
MPEDIIRSAFNRSYSITATIDTPGGAGVSGVLLAAGGYFAGLSLYVRNGLPAFTYNYFGSEYTTITAAEPVPGGAATVAIEFDYDGGGLGKGGLARLLLDGRQVGAARIERTVPFGFSADEGIDVGMDGGTPGQIHTVIATTWILGVAMPSGYPHPPAVRRELFDRVCRGVPLFRAAQDMGVSTTRAWVWWRDAGAMKLHIGGRGEGERGLVEAGNMSLPGGRGHRLSVEERVEIMRGRDAGLSDAEIADQLGRDRTTIYRETRRNCNADGDYHALMAHARAGEKARRPKEFKLNDPQLCAAIERWMDDGWSPKLIAEMLARDHPDDKLARVSHETIYTCLYVQGRGQLRAELNKCLSTKRTARKPRGSTERRGKFSDVITISQRPAVVDDRAVPGHWESQWCCQAA